MHSTPERHLHELDQGLYWQRQAEAFAMNKIVLEHYPVEKLPEDLRARVRGLNSVTLTLEEEGPNNVERPKPLSREDILKFLDKPYGESLNTVEGIRALRDEWD